MQLRREFRLAFGLILGLQLATAFGVIALLNRMAPAIERLAADNVDSLGAIEEMLASLTSSEGAPSQSSSAEFHEAFARARSNVTEKEEGPLLDAIDGMAEAALRGETEARAAVVLNLRRLSEVNRQAMLRTDAEAQRLATAGAWTAAILALLGFLATRILAERAEHRVITPLFDIYSTLNAAKSGEARRRCGMHSAAAEIEAIAAGVNRLLDAR